MLGELKLLTMASAMARHAAARHEVLAENIANADTAGYRAKDIEPFAQSFERMASTAGRETSGAISTAEWRFSEVYTPGAESPNGNTVSLEDQMMRTIEAQQDHQAATAIYKKTLDILRLSLGKNL
ncbi:MAG: FlgB family protein [Pseudomonadota bacterium]|nr:FlgB family protein [Pseudomonadota bacterium]